MRARGKNPCGVKARKEKPGEAAVGPTVLPGRGGGPSEVQRTAGEARHMHGHRPHTPQTLRIALLIILAILVTII